MEEWEDHPTDEALFALYMSLVAPHNFLQHALDMVESRLSKHMEGFRLVPRGSFVRQIALKAAVDLDVDIILPRSFHSYEEIRDKCHAAGNFEPFFDVCRDVFHLIDSRSRKNLTEEFGVDLNLVGKVLAGNKDDGDDEDDDEDDKNEDTDADADGDKEIDLSDSTASVSLPSDLSFSILARGEEEIYSQH